MTHSIFMEFAINSMENILFLLLMWNAYFNQVFFRQSSATSWQFQSLKNDIFHFGEAVNFGKTSPDGPDILPLVCLAVIFNARTFLFCLRLKIHILIKSFRLVSLTRRPHHLYFSQVKFVVDNKVYTRIESKYVARNRSFYKKVVNIV